MGTIYTYDAMNRLKEVKDALGNIVQRNVYDAGGLLIKAIDAAGYKAGSNDAARYGIEYAYDAGNRVVTVTTPEAKARGKSSESYAYDAAGNVVGFTDGEGNTTTYERDKWGRATRVTDAGGEISQYTYDYVGNVTSTTDENGHTTYYTYNSMNLLSSMKDPEGRMVSYKYDREGRLVRETDRNGRNILYEYNSDGSLTQKRIAGGDEYERFLYNRDGSLMAAINASGVDVFEYTANNQLKKKTRNGTTMLEYEYDKNGSVAKVTDNTGAVTGYTYDALGRMKEVLDGTNKVALYSYNADGTISNISYSSGEKTDYVPSLSTAYKYDRDKNVISLTSINPKGDIINEFKYKYDNNGNQTEKTENGKTTTYDYDKLNRLVEAGPETGKETFTYDAAGNRLSRRLGEETTTYTYDALNRLTQSTNNGIITAYGYDSNGNLTSETTKGQVRSYTYDGFNRLIQVQNPDNTWMHNEYDALGQRVATVENGIWHGFTVDRGSVIAETDAADKPVTRYIRGIGLAAQKDSKGTLSYYLHNAHGDVVNLVDAHGKVLNSYEYDAFGNTTTYAETVANRFRYAGEQFDSITGQYYLRARYYDPHIGRFTQEDTYRGDGLNLYAYVGNNPVLCFLRGTNENIVNSNKSV